MSLLESDDSFCSESSDSVIDNDVKQSKRIEALIQNLPVLGANFNVLKKIGAGTFSCVYLAETKFVDESGRKAKVAIKHLVPTCHPKRVIRELRCLQEIGGKDHVGGIKMCLRNKDCIVFIMPYQQHDRFSEYVMEMDAEETKQYLTALLIALRRVHEYSVIHRDVKPSNFLYSRKDRKYLLVDFGLAQKIDENMMPDKQKDSRKRKRDDGENEEVNVPSSKRPALQCLNYNVPKTNNLTKTSYDSWTKQIQIVPPNKGEKLFAKPPTPLTRSLGELCDCDGKPQVCKLCITRKSVVSPRAGTPGFRPPEVLLKYPNQTGAIDVWAVGIIFLSILSRTYPFFKSPDDVTALAEMISVFGSERIKNLAKRLGRNVIISKVSNPFNLKLLCMSLAKKRCSKYFSEDNKVNPTLPKFPDSAYDLLSRLLDVDPFTRITACEALNHSFLC